MLLPRCEVSEDLASLSTMNRRTFMEEVEDEANRVDRRPRGNMPQASDQESYPYIFPDPTPPLFPTEHPSISALHYARLGKT